LFSWNYFLFALVLSKRRQQDADRRAFNFVGEGSTQWGVLMAAATLIALPRCFGRAGAALAGFGADARRG